MIPGPDNDFLAPHALLLLESHRRLLGRELVAAGTVPEKARALYEAPFVVVSHDTAPDPVFNYANLAAQHLFEMDWNAFVRTPSRLSAGPVHRDERARLLEEVARNGYIDNYAGIRVSKSGRQFRIERAVVWNLTDALGRYAGQAAVFSDWQDL